MKNNYIPILKHAVCYALLALGCLTAQAQKLPKVQQAGMRAPADVKVDGRPTEWLNKFGAHNPATNIFYTICNDNTNLYLAIQTNDAIVINKIMAGGVTLVVQKSGEKSDKNGTSITYPFFGKGNIPYFSLHIKEEIPPSTEVADSIMKANNNKLIAHSKFIRVIGMPGLDTLISIYNNNGVKAAGLFNNKKTYTCELSVALKHFGLSINNPVKFSYHILLNGLLNNISRGFTLDIAAGKMDDGITPMPQAAIDAMTLQRDKIYAAEQATTDFWGEYTLAK